MKFLAVMFSIYLLGLNLMPCEDGFTSDSDKNRAEISAISDADHGHFAADLCSPFCQCHCCHVHVVDFKVPEMLMVAPGFSKNIISLPPDFHGQNLYSHFQPPRV